MQTKYATKERLYTFYNMNIKSGLIKKLGISLSAVWWTCYFGKPNFIIPLKYTNTFWIHYNKYSIKCIANLKIEKEKIVWGNSQDEKKECLKPVLTEYSNS